MAQISNVPDIGALEIPVDAWTKPFWDGTARHVLTIPRCGSCSIFRWPPGPFCPECQSQEVDWVDPGAALLYSYTVMREVKSSDGEEGRSTIPALVEFPDAGGIRLLTAIVGAPLDRLQIGAALRVGWVGAADAVVPVFHLIDD